jgi:hypothetical protein
MRKIMGQDTSCGICGKHYQNCKHYVKEHIDNGDGLPLCGGKVAGDYVSFSRDSDAEDICNKCKSSLLKLGKTDFQQFLFLISENQ